MRSLCSIADTAKWPAPQQAQIQQKITGLRGLTDEELHACRLLTAGRTGIRNLWAYFFKVMRQNRINQVWGTSENDAVTQGDDAFADFENNKEVNFNGG